MKYDTKVLIISHLPLPYHKIGSWTKMYDSYLKDERSIIDGVLCPKIVLKEKHNLEYVFLKKSPLSNLKSKIYKNNYNHVNVALSKYLKKYPTSKFIIQVIDNFGVLRSIINFIHKNKYVNKIYIQYFYHGYLLFKTQTLQTEKYLSKTNEFIFLSEKSLKANIEIFSNMPESVSLLYNGIDTNIFKPKSFNKNGKIIFLWCSRDRPKKGLNIILEIWDEFYNENNNSELWVVGDSKKTYGKGIKSYGNLINDKLPEIFNQAHVYLFPTLYEEGFGLTLAEALHCGCFCIASNLGSIPEVLNYGEYGWLIDNPENPQNWLKAMKNYMHTKPKTKKIPKDLYSLESWISNMNIIIENAKNRIE